MRVAPFRVRTPEARIDVVEPSRTARKGSLSLDLGHDVRFSTEALRTYAFARWEPEIYDLMVLAAAVEYADKVVRRSSLGWRRCLSLRIPVHDPARWRNPAVARPLRSALSFLTGDFWSIEFIRRARSAPSPSDSYLALSVPTEAVLPHSDGMDSLAVAGILGASLGDRLVRVRVGSKKPVKPREPFALVPYRVPGDMRNREPSARSRGFKFALISGIAAYLTDAEKIIIPESGQGAIGPALVTVGHTYPDYRNHPCFTDRFERFLAAFLKRSFRYEFPRLWNTKGETLREFLSRTSSDSWISTRSCWRGSQWSSVHGQLRQCGICAACLLRRQAVHAAGLAEPSDNYVCVDMTAQSLDDGVDPDFTKLNRAYREYAIAGVLHMHHLAAMASDKSRVEVARHAALLASVLGITREQALRRINILLRKHAEEWSDFVSSLGPRSFVGKWLQR